MHALLRVLPFVAVVSACGLSCAAESSTAAGDSLSANAVVPVVLGTVNSPLSVVPVVAVGGREPHEFTLEGTLPAGLSFSTTTGRLEGTPGAVLAATDFSVTITDASDRTASATFSLAVEVAAAADPAVVEDFSTYTSTANLIADPRGIYMTFEDINVGNVVLDETVGFGSSTKSMRYDYADRTGSGSRCSDYTVSRSMRFPNNGDIQEVWVELTVRTSSDFTTQAPAAWNCTSDQGLKFVNGGVNPGDRFSIGLRTGLTPPASGQLWFGYPNNKVDPAGKVGFSTAGNMTDGNWHQYRCHWKISTGSPGAPNPDGVARCWVDGQLVYQGTGLLTNSTAGNTPPLRFYGLALGRNINQGPDRPQSIWWGQVKIYESNPGW